MRLDEIEKRAIKYALSDFDGEIYLFGSRLNNKKKGGDIDILLIPRKKENSLKLTLSIQNKFFSICEQKLDILIYSNNNFGKEILKNAKRIVIGRI